LETGHDQAIPWQTMRMGATNVEPLTIDGWGAVTIDTEKNGKNT